MNNVKILPLVGLKFVKIENLHNEKVHFYVSENEYFEMYHDNCDCVVYVEDVAGDWEDLLNTPILVAEERSCGEDEGDYCYSQWTFYEFQTIKGTVTVRWFGTTSGPYSVNVNWRHWKEDSLINYW